MDKQKALVLWFDQLGIEDVPLVGGKNASLGEMYQLLTPKGIKIPNGFALTAFAYRNFLESNNLMHKIKDILSDLNTHDMQNLAERGHKVRDLIMAAEFPEDLKEAINEGYKNMCLQYGENTDVAVRSSATAEDLPDASFAGQQETYLNVKGNAMLMEACKKCFASLFTNRAISYRQDKGFDHFSIALSVGVQKMVRSDVACSGVMFSIDTETGFKDAVLVSGAYGLGENVVQGAVNPDEFYVFKPTLREGFKPIISRKLGSKQIRMVYDTQGNKPVKNITVPEEERKKFCMTDDEVLQLSKWAMTIEDHYSEKAGHFKPMDMEWAKDGMTGELFIVQARPETVHSNKDQNKLISYVLRGKGEILVKGSSVGSRIGNGKANVIKDVKDISKFNKGEVLVTEMTDPDWEPIMKIASAIVTNRGGRTCFGGNTMILTDKGFMTIGQVFNNKEENLLTLSFNKSTKKIEWKPIIASMKRSSITIEASVSLSGKIKDNTICVTPDHKMVNVRNAQIVNTEMAEMLKKEEMVCIAQKIPSLEVSSEKDVQLAYLLGGIMTDGSIYKSRTHGEVQFIQKNTQEKEQFIRYMNECMVSIYNKPFAIQEKKVSSGFIRGKMVMGQATAYRLYSKQVVYDMYDQEQAIVTTLLRGNLELALNFLAGVIDGDGSFCNNRINVYISEERLLQAVVVACMKLGIAPQVTKNRNIHNVQIVEKLDEILKRTKRVKGTLHKRTIKSRFFAARQIFDENAKGQEKLRRDNNLYVSSDYLKNTNSSEVRSIIDGDFRMHRMCKVVDKKPSEVYNITVADNHTYVVFTKKLTPIIVNNCHAAIISRELGIPCIVGSTVATSKISPGQDVTVDCSQGEDGFVYDGLIDFAIEEHDIGAMPHPKTKVMMNVGDPSQAFELSFIPNDGVGLAREEFIINNNIVAHPLALINYNSLKDQDAKKKIEELTYGYPNKSKFFVDKLAEGIAMIAAAFYPKDVIVRLSDFKSNEYANLLGGKEFEPKEDNPMIGWRGASRYYDEKYKAAFDLECQGFVKAIKEFGLKNIIIMIPICRTVEEGIKVIDILAKNGLVQGQDGLKVYAMCEIPSNVILADEFLEIFDGFSIGSNDLTQMTLGVDRDSELVAHVYDERNAAVKKLISQVIKIANEKGKYIGICGQAPSDFPDFAQFLVEEGIQSISLNPDTVIKTRIKIADKEKELGK